MRGDQHIWIDDKILKNIR